MSEKTKKQVGSTRHQCLAHHIFLEIYIAKSIVAMHNFMRITLGIGCAEHAK